MGDAAADGALLFFSGSLRLCFLTTDCKSPDTGCRILDAGRAEVVAAQITVKK
jgi:hypothetical protein